MVAPLLAIGGLLASSIAVLASSDLIVSIESLFQTVFSNTGNIFYIGVGLAIASLVAVNAYQSKGLSWRRDLGGLVIGIAVFFGLVVGAPIVSGQVAGYTADIKVTVDNPAFQDSRISAVEVTNVKRIGPFSILGPDSGEPLSALRDSLQGTVSVDCDSGNTIQTGFSVQPVEGTTGTKTVRVAGLKQGDTCTATVTLKNNGRVIDTAEQVFTVQ